MIYSFLPTLTAVAMAMAAQTSSPMVEDPFQLYGDRIEFEVLRNGKPVGEHVTRFQRVDDGLKVESDMHLKVPVFLFLNYKMDYSATEIWRDGALVALDVDVEMGGDEASIKGQLEDGIFVWESASGEHAVSEPMFPTNHWNSKVLDSDRVLNTLTGNLNRVAILQGELELVQTGDGKRPAYRYTYQGELENEVWYDQAGRWVKLRFEATDGSVIEYVCKRCGAGA